MGTSGDVGKRWVFWCISMTPFCYIVYTLFIGLAEAQANQAENVRAQVKWACWATVFSWCTYPIVYTFPMFAGTSDGKEGLSAEAIVAVQCGYTISDVISKSVSATSSTVLASPSLPTRTPSLRMRKQRLESRICLTSGPGHSNGPQL